MPQAYPQVLPSQYLRVSYLRVTLCHDLRMDKYEERRRALRGLVDDMGRGAIATVAAAIGKDASYVSRMLYEPGKAGRKRIGEDSWDDLLSAYPQLSPSVEQPQGPPVSGSATGSEYVRVLHLDGEGEMGDGAINDDFPDVIRSMDFTPHYIRSVVGFVPPPGRLILVTGRGDSMIPVIQPGESLIVDTGVTSFDGDGIYLINTGHGQQVKGLQARGEAVYVVSANTALYPPFPMPNGTLVGGKVYLRNRIDRFN